MRHSTHICSTRLVRLVLLVPIALAGMRTLAQTATDNCIYNAGNQYTVGSSCSYQGFNKPTSFNPSGTVTGCFGGNFDDAFGWFTATSTATYITYDPESNDRPIIHVFTGACGSLTQVGCSAAGANGWNANLQLSTVVGVDYLVRISRYNGNSGMNGNICIWNLPPPPANDDPCNAVVLDVGDFCTGTPATNASATASAGIPPPGCANYAGGDVWFSFVAPASGMIRVTTGAGTLNDTGMGLYSADACNGTFTLMDCDDDDGTGNMSLILSPAVIPGNVYYVRVWGYAGAFGSFNICAINNGPPVNDNPCGALALSLSSTCSYTSYVNINATNTQNVPAPGCGTYNGNDVWFTFVAPANGLVTLRTLPGSMSNMDMAVYSASSCSGPFQLIACDGASGAGNMPFLTLTPLELVPGNTYYVRMWANGGPTGQFELCAQIPPTTTGCTYVLRMYDSQGDGWGSSNVSVQVGGASPVAYTNTGQDQDVAYISVQPGDAVNLSYATGGSGGQSEIRYTLQLIYGMLYGDGPTPGTGLRYAATATCQSPPALNSDCFGAQGICDSQQISANPTNTGLTAELNVNNRGCLGSNERQGTWYTFSPSQSGTIGFTIAPDNASNDYDFAVWGPFVTLSCAPSVPPVRCNYSGDTGNTGLSAAGTNASEDADGPKWSSLLNVIAGEYYFLYVSNYTQSGLAFNLTWQLTNGASLDCTILPLELLGFDAQARENDVVLDWALGSNPSGEHFIVERSQDALEFAPIGTVQAQEGTGVAHYDFVDPQPAPGINYYRLAQVHTDGSSVHSLVKAVVFQPSTGHLFPNPANDRIHITFRMETDQTVQLRVLDASGRLVHHRSVLMAAGEQRYQLPLTGFEPGSYTMILDLADGTVLHAGRFIVQ